MARDRQLRNLDLGEYQATCFWSQGVGIEQRDRHAEYAGIRVEEKWVYIYLRDGEEIVKLSRTRNQTAQVYVDMSLRDAIEERIINGVRHSSHCCWGEFGMERAADERGEDSLFSERTPCPEHTAAWLADEIQSKIDSLIADSEWPAILAQRKIDALDAEEAMREAAAEREQAKLDGYAEWRKNSGEWLVAADNRRVGDIVPVRRRDGSISHRELTVQVSPKLYRVGDEIAAAEVESRKTKKLLVFPCTAVV